MMRRRSYYRRTRRTDGFGIFFIIVIVASIGITALLFNIQVNEGEIEDMRVDYEGDSTAYIIRVNGKEHKLRFGWIDYNLFNVGDCVKVYFLGNVKKINC